MGAGLTGAWRQFARRPVATLGWLTLLGATLSGAAVAGGLLVNVAGFADLLQRHSGLMVYLSDDAPAGRLAELTVEVGALDPGAEVRAVPREVALAELRVALGSDAELLEGLGADAIPDSVEVLPTSAAAGQSLLRLARRIEGLPNVASVSWMGLANPGIQRLDALLRLLRTVGWVVFVLSLVVGAALEAALAARITAGRAPDLRLLRLLGASTAQVVAPYLWTGALLGIGGGLLALASLAGLIGAVEAAVGADAALLGLRVTLPGVVPSLAFCGLSGVVGAGGAYLGVAPSVRK